MKPKANSKKINKINKPLARLTKENKGEISNRNKNERAELQPMLWKFKGQLEATRTNLH